MVDSSVGVADLLADEGGGCWAGSSHDSGCAFDPFAVGESVLVQGHGGENDAGGVGSLASSEGHVG